MRLSIHICFCVCSVCLDYHTVQQMFAARCHYMLSSSGQTRNSENWLHCFYGGLFPTWWLAHWLCFHSFCGVFWLQMTGTYRWLPASAPADDDNKKWRERFALLQEKNRQLRCRLDGLCEQLNAVELQEKSVKTVDKSTNTENTQDLNSLVR